MIRLITISPKSNFLKSRLVDSYQSAFFHGVCGRDGEWFPHDTRGIDAQTESPSPLVVQYNRYGLNEFTWPGSWPVVSSELAQTLGGIETLRFQRVIVDKVIDQEWHVGKPIIVEAGDLTARELLARFPAVDQSTESDRFELQSYRLRKIANRFKGTTPLQVELGTAPLSERDTVDCSAEMFEKYPVLAYGGSLFVRESIFSVFEQLVHPEFFDIRTYQIY